MNEFKLQFYFNIFKDKTMNNIVTFKANFKKLYGDFNYINELIIMIEKYQIKKYGCVLKDFEIKLTKEDCKRLAVNSNSRKHNRLKGNYEKVK